jgi:hypothetical protein
VYLLGLVASILLRACTDRPCRRRFSDVSAHERVGPQINDQAIMLASSHVVGPEQGSDAIFRLLDLAVVWNLPEYDDPWSRTLQGVEPGSEAARSKMLTRTLGSAKQIPLARGGMATS